MLHGRVLLDNDHSARRIEQLALETTRSRRSTSTSSRSKRARDLAVWPSNGARV